MAKRCACVMRGTKSPLDVLTMSNWAELSGVGVLMPTFWAILPMLNNKARNSTLDFMFFGIKLSDLAIEGRYDKSYKEVDLLWEKGNGCSYNIHFGSWNMLDF